MENKLTAVQWLVEKYAIVMGLGSKELMKEHIERAKQIEKQQIADGYLLGAYVEKENNAEELQNKLIEALEFSKKYLEGTPAETIVNDFLDMYKIETYD